jgi:hypothetical protein
MNDRQVPRLHENRQAQENRLESVCEQGLGSCVSVSWRAVHGIVKEAHGCMTAVTMALSWTPESA